MLPAPERAAAVLRADLAAAEDELDRADTLGDAAAVVRVRRRLDPLIRELRRAIRLLERQRASV